MSELGSLVVSLEANIANFETALDKAQHLAEANAEAIAAQFDKIKEKALEIGEAYVGIEGVMKFTEMIAGSVEAADKMGKLAQSTGVSVESLSRLSVSAKLADVDQQSLATSMEKLSKSMLSAQDGTGKSAAAYNALGISVTDANGKLKSSDQVMTEVADVFSKTEDGAAKTAVAMALFGKSGAAMIPMLNQGSEELNKFADLSDKLGLTMDKELTQRAQEVKDRFTIMGMAMQSVGMNVTRDLLPTLDAVSSVMVDTATDTTTLSNAANVLTGIFKSVADVAMTVGNQVDWMGRGIGGLAAAAAAAAQGEFTQAKAIWTQLNADQDAADAKFTERINKLWDGANNAEANKPKPSEQKGQISYNPNNNASANASAYDALVKSIQAKIEVDQQDLAGLTKLSAADTFAIQTRAAMAQANSKLTEGEKEHVGALLDSYTAVDKQWQSQQQATTAQDAYLKIANQVASQAEQHNIQLAFEASLIGKNAEQVKILTAQYQIQGEELKKLLAIEDDKAFKERDHNAGVMKAYQDSIDKVKASAENTKEQAAIEIAANDAKARSWDTGTTNAVKAYMDTVTNAAAQSNKLFSDAFKGMEDALVNFVKTGKLNFTSLADSIMTDLIRIQVQQNITGPLVQAMSGSKMFSSLFNANGNAFGSSGVHAFANGGTFTNSVVDSPTTFAFANGGGFSQGVMGEAGPEAVMPLVRGPDGKLGVASQGGGTQVIVNPQFAPTINAAPGTDINGIILAISQLMPAFISQNQASVVGAVNKALMSRGQAPIRM
jgi:lambda family phage tail tape measure protein